jgi:uncharacterized protein (TIGR02284 family)
MSHTRHDIDVLNRLIATTLDSADGYRDAADDARGPRFARTFASRAQERAQVAGQLQQQVRRLGRQPEDAGTVLAGAHRLFVNLRSAVEGGDIAVVDEVERGEEHLQAQFEQALQDDHLSSPTRSVILQAYVSVKTGHDQMRDFRHALHHLH